MSDQVQTLYCANHPSVETQLRCNNCNKPICPKCAVLLPTGYRCRECVGKQQKVFDTSQWWDYPVAFIIAAILSFGGSFVAGFLGFFIIFLAPLIGMGIAEVVRLAVGRRRSPRLFLLAGIGAAVGALPLLLGAITGALAGMGRGGLLNLLWMGLYTFTVTSTVYYRLRGIKIR